MFLLTSRPMLPKQADLPAARASKAKSQAPGAGEKPPGSASVPTLTAPAAANEVSVPTYRYEIKGRRDPFRALDVTRTIQAAAAPVVRPPGLKGQLVSEIRVLGIVRSKGALMAMVQGFRNKTFFLHPNDPLFDGKVQEIRSDSVVFNQFLTDNLGKKVSQQIVKKLYPTRGEGNNEK
jgi:hypothetical protein